MACPHYLDYGPAWGIALISAEFSDRPIYLYYILDQMKILGISAYYHDSAACIIEDGEIIAAAQEERFTRKKHDPSFPINDITYCLGEAKATPK